MRTILQRDPQEAGTDAAHPRRCPLGEIEYGHLRSFPSLDQGYMYLFTVLDCFSKYAFAFPIRRHEAPILARLLVDRVFSEFGIPRQLLSDLGRELQGSIMTELCRVLGIDKLRSTSYRPETNGQCERLHRTLNSMLGKVVSENQKDWEYHVDPVLAAYRATVHESTQYTPNYLMFGREVNLPLDLAYGVDPAEAQAYDSYDSFVSEQQDRLRSAFSLARESLGKATSRNKKSYDLRARPCEFQPGTWVWLYSPRRFVGRTPKWTKTYSGPYLIVERPGAVNLGATEDTKDGPFHHAR